MGFIEGREENQYLLETDLLCASLAHTSLSKAYVYRGFWNLSESSSKGWGFPGSSVGKESTCNAGDPGSIPGLGRSPEEGLGYSLQYSWASLVAQLVKNPPAMPETWVQSLGWEDSPGEGKGNPLQYSGLEYSTDCIVHGITKCWTWLRDFHLHIWTKEKFPNSPGRGCSLPNKLKRMHLGW